MISDKAIVAARNAFDASIPWKMGENTTTEEIHAATVDALTAALPFLHPDATPEYVQTSPPLGDRPLTEREKALAECEAIARWYLDGSKDDAVPHIIDAIAALGKGEGK